MRSLHHAMLFAAVAVAVPAFGAEDANETPKDVPKPTPTQSFEGQAVPAGWGEGGLTLGVSDRHFKAGAKSLRWDWKAGQTCLVTKPEGLAAAAQARAGGIEVWIYNETPTKGHLTFRFGAADRLGTGDAAPYEFTFGLDYEGWRAAWVEFKSDATNPAYKGPAKPVVEAMEIVAPSGADRQMGTVFLDQVEFPTNVAWTRTPDAQVPFVNAERGGRDVSEDIQDEHVDLCGYNWSLIPPTVMPAAVSPEQSQAFKAIADRYEQWLYGKGIDLKAEPYYQQRSDARDKYIRDGKAAYEKLGIVRKDGAITGTPLFALIDTRHKPSFTDVFENVILPLAFDWKLNGDAESKQKFFDLLDHLHDQGWAAGSANGTLDHQTLRISGYMHAIYMMRDELRAAGKLDRELATMRWYTYFNNSYRETIPPGESADQIRNGMLHRLLLVLAQDDGPAKARDMAALVRWEDAAVAISPGWTDTIKPDFVGFHHRGVYGNTYAPDAFHMAALCFYLQHDTAFAMSEQSASNIRNALLTARIISNKYDSPMAISGRMPFMTAVTNKIAPGFAYMALSSDTSDRQMAKAFKRLWDPSSPYFTNGVFDQTRAGIFFAHGLGALELMKRVADGDVKAEPAPSGNWVKPYAAMMVHRRDDWMVSFKGWSKYVWSFELGAGENRYGRNFSHGFLQILNAGGPAASGIVEPGWDWRRLPGTTTVNLSLDQLGDTSVEMRMFSDQTFVGGATLAGRDGLFAMRLHDTAADPSFWANKSVFCFDDRIVCLGSGIANGDAKHPTETTLFQTALATDSTPTYVNDMKPVTRLDREATTRNGGKAWLLDAAGNGYVVPDAKGLHVLRSRQSSMDDNGKQRTEGNFATAWIDHGTAPKDAGYEYAILVQAGDASRVAQFAESTGYAVLRRDAAVHAVRDARTGATGYAIYQADRPVDVAPLVKASAPCMAMLRPDGETLTLGVANPDLGLIPASEPQPDDIVGGISDRHLLRSRSPTSTVALTLAGAWIVSAGEAKARVEGGDTVVEVSCKDGLTSDVTLRRR